jgi:ribonuclease P protein component
MQSRFTLGKAERLKKRKEIEAIFDLGESFSLHPFRVFYLTNAVSIQERIIDHEKMQESCLLQFGVGASKKLFKKAVDRNRIKRLIREAYRLQNAELKKILEEKREQSLSLFILYVGKEMPQFSFVKEKVFAVLEKLAKKIS